MLIIYTRVNIYIIYIYIYSEIQSSIDRLEPSLIVIPFWENLNFFPQERGEFPPFFHSFLKQTFPPPLLGIFCIVLLVSKEIQSRFMQHAQCMQTNKSYLKYLQPQMFYILPCQCQLVYFLGYEIAENA